MLASILDPISNLLDKVVPDADERAKLAHEIATMAERHAHELALAQIEVNKAEAASNKFFVSAWRPAVGWVCVIGLFWHFIGQPIAVFFILLFGVEIPPLPEFDLNTLMTLLLGLLGMGSLRTFEKYKGVARNGL